MSALSTAAGSSRRILVVDDNDASRYAKCRILRHAGHEVVEASSGGEVLQLVLDAEPDLVLLDIRLPDISGLDVCRQLKRDSRTCMVPVLQMSASLCDDQSKVAGLQGGADGYIAEPVEPALLLATVAAFLRMRRAEQEIRELALEWQATFDAIADGVALVNSSGHIVRCNHGLTTLLDLPPDSVIGAPINQLFPAPPDQALWPQSTSGQRYRAERSVGGRTFALTVDPVFGGQGRLHGGVCIACDITERKRLDEQLRQTQKLESIGMLAGGVAHDFNNLLTGILGNASLALDMLYDPPAIERALRDIVRASERAADLTRQLLAYSGKGRVVPQLVDLSTLVDGILPLVKASFAHKVRLVLNLAAGLPSVDADKTQIEQVIMNLLINASEAIGENPGTIEVTTGVREFSGHPPHDYIAENELRGSYVALVVRDEGTGMDEATLRRIFDPFFTTKFLGRGLGLSAVLGIVRGHHGAMRVTSKPGRGTTFEILFPTAAGTVQKPRPTDSAAHPVRPAAGVKGAVLVVDDEQIVRTFFKTALESAGYRVVTATTGAQALRVFRKDPARFAFVLLDLVMPEMSGKEVLPLLLDLHPNTRIVMTSGQVEEEVRRNLAAWPIAGFIQKPCSVETLLQQVQDAAPVSGKLAAG